LRCYLYTQKAQYCLKLTRNFNQLLLRGQGPLKWQLTAVFYEPVYRPNMLVFSWVQLQSTHFLEALARMLTNLFSVTLLAVSTALWWKLCQTLEVFRSSVSEQRIMYAVSVLCVFCARCAVD